MPSLRVLGNGIRSFPAATKIKPPRSELHFSSGSHMWAKSEMQLRAAAAADFVLVAALHLSKRCFDLFDF